MPHQLFTPVQPQTFWCFLRTRKVQQSHDQAACSTQRTMDRTKWRWQTLHLSQVLACFLCLGEHVSLAIQPHRAESVTVITMVTDEFELLSTDDIYPMTVPKHCCANFVVICATIGFTNTPRPEPILSFAIVTLLFQRPHPWFSVSLQSNPVVLCFL